MKANLEISFRESQDYPDKSCMLRLFLTREDVAAIKTTNLIMKENVRDVAIFSTCYVRNNIIPLLEAIITESEKETP